MAYVAACLMAPLCFLINKGLLKYLGPRVVYTWGPAAEEVAKTLLPWMVGGDILVTHVTFGLLEGVYDCFTAKLHPGRAAVGSLAGHTLFGLITSTLLWQTGLLALALVTAIASHMLWNRAALRLSR